MSEVIRRRHPLESFLAQRNDKSDIRCAVDVRVQPAYDCVNLRGDPGDVAFMDAAESVLGQALPVAANTWTSGPQNIYWLGPDEWLIVAWANTLGALCTHFEGVAAAVNNQNGGLTQLSVSGESARDLLAKACTLDLHPNVFSVGQCAQTCLAKASVLLALMDSSPSFNLIVRRSFAEYVALWLDHAGEEFGISFDADE